jgi:hypothetical protein
LGSFNYLLTQYRTKLQSWSKKDTRTLQTQQHGRGNEPTNANSSKQAVRSTVLAFICSSRVLEPVNKSCLPLFMDRPTSQLLGRRSCGAAEMNLSAPKGWPLLRYSILPATYTQLTPAFAYALHCIIMDTTDAAPEVSWQTAFLAPVEHGLCIHGPALWAASRRTFEAPRLAVHLAVPVSG